MIQFTYIKLQWISNSSTLSYTQSYVYDLQTRICYMQTYVYVPQPRIRYTQTRIFLNADLRLCPSESYLLPVEFKSVHSSNSVNVLSSFHQASHQQECYIGVL